MKKILYLLILIIVGIMLSIPSTAVSYSFSEEDCKENIAERELNDLINSLPDDIKDKIKDPAAGNGDIIAKSYSFQFFAGSILESITSVLPDELNKLSVSIGFLIVISLIKRSSVNLSSRELLPAINMCTTLASALTVFTLKSIQ